MFNILALLAGIGYGYTNPGKGEKATLLKRGAILGVVVALALTFLKLVFTGIPGPIQAAIITTFSVIFFTIYFIAGVFIGDWLEQKTKK